MALRIAPGSKWVLIGDSITDCGRAQPVGEGLFGALGTGYVAMVDALIAATYPTAGLRMVNMGTGGHTVRDLKNRWERDVLSQKPDWLSVMIGTNDVWRQFDCPTRPEIQVLPEEFERIYDEIIVAAKPHVKGLILATPFYIESNRFDAMRARMDEYSAIVRALAERHDAIFVDTQAAFDQVLEHTYTSTLAGDRVHPNMHGTAVLTRAFLKAIDFEF